MWIEIAVAVTAGWSSLMSPPVIGRSPPPLVTGTGAGTLTGTGFESVLPTITFVNGDAAAAIGARNTVAPSTADASVRKIDPRMTLRMVLSLRSLTTPTLGPAGRTRKRELPTE